MLSNHPESRNFGLDCDYTLWAEFNKEILMRNWIRASRECTVLEKPPVGFEVDFGTDFERSIANAALNELIYAGYLNPTTYMKTF